MSLRNAMIMAVIAVFTGGLFTDVSAKIKCVPKIYAFGFAASFNDSIIYFTDIQEIDSAWIDDKNDFLISRDNYSYQLRNYLSSVGLEHRTCIISFSLERKDVEKKYQKMRSKYVKAGKFDIKNIDSKDFHFTAIKPDEYTLSRD